MGAILLLENPAAQCENQGEARALQSPAHRARLVLSLAMTCPPISRGGELAGPRTWATGLRSCLDPPTRAVSGTKPPVRGLTRSFAPAPPTWPRASDSGPIHTLSCLLRVCRQRHVAAGSRTGAHVCPRSGPGRLPFHAASHAASWKMWPQDSRDCHVSVLSTPASVPTAGEALGKPHPTLCRPMPGTGVFPHAHPRTGARSPTNGHGHPQTGALGLSASS